MPRMEPSLRIGRRKSSCAAVLPTVEPKATPHEGDAMTSPGNPASAMASRTDSAESTATLPMVRLYLRGISLASIPSPGAPTRVRRPSSPPQSAMVRIPLRPASSPSRNAAGVCPSGERKPIPVTATRFPLLLIGTTHWRRAQNARGQVLLSRSLRGRIRKQGNGPGAGAGVRTGGQRERPDGDFGLGRGLAQARQQDAFHPGAVVAVLDEQIAATGAWCERVPRSLAGKGHPVFRFA